MCLIHELNHPLCGGGTDFDFKVRRQSICFSAFDNGCINAYSSLFSFASSCSIFSRRRISQTDAPMAKGSKMYWMISSFDRGVGGISGRGACVDCVD